MRTFIVIDLLKLLLEKGGNPNLPEKENKATPVHFAAYDKKKKHQKN